LIAGQNYSWCVINSRDYKFKSDTSIFRILSDKKIKIISDSLRIIKGKIDANSGIGQFLMVKYLESKELNYDALKGYESLVKSYPSVENYTDNYLLFLGKQGLSKKAEALLLTIKK
jgi:hypothetical protein